MLFKIHFLQNAILQKLMLPFKKEIPKKYIDHQIIKKCYKFNYSLIPFKTINFNVIINVIKKFTVHEFFIFLNISNHKIGEIIQFQ
jgi:hypothetical protein